MRHDLRRQWNHRLNNQQPRPGQYVRTIANSLSMTRPELLSRFGNEPKWSGYGNPSLEKWDDRTIPHPDRLRGGSGEGTCPYGRTRLARITLSGQRAESAEKS